MSHVLRSGPDRTQYCCLCGEPRKPTQKPVESFGNRSEIVTMRHYREMKPGRWEDSPQLLVHVGMSRNGGVDVGNTHMCDGCIVVGLQRAKKWVDETLTAMGAS